MGRIIVVIAVSRALQRETAGLRDLFMQAPGFMAVLSGPDHVFTLSNAAYQQVIGHRDILGKTVAEALPELHGQGFYDLLDTVFSSGEPYVGLSAPVTLIRVPDGAPEERFLDFIYQPIRDLEGAVIGIFVEGSDVTERVRAEQLVERRLRREVLGEGDDLKVTRRLVGMLARRGYSQSMAVAVVTDALAAERERRRV